MTTEQLTTQLAEQVLKWQATPDRFLMQNRRWLPRWRFQPTKRVEDALRVLEAAAPDEFTLRGDKSGSVWVSVRVARSSGKASGKVIAKVICLALARALQIEVGPSA